MEDVVESDSGASKRAHGDGRVDMSNVVYGALLDIKEAQGEMKAKLDHLALRFDKLDTRIDKLHEKATVTETKLARIIWTTSGVVGLVVLMATALSRYMK